MPTPLAIDMMLHFACSASPWPRPDAPACIEQMAVFLTEKLIVEDAEAASGYRTTDRGDAYVKHLCAVQFPVAQWEQPPPKDWDGKVSP